MPIFKIDDSVSFSPDHFREIVKAGGAPILSRAYKVDIEAMNQKLKALFGNQFSEVGVRAEAAKFEVDGEVAYNMVYLAVNAERVESTHQLIGDWGVLGCGDSQSPKVRTNMAGVVEYVVIEHEDTQSVIEGLKKGRADLIVRSRIRKDLESGALIDLTSSALQAIKNDALSSEYLIDTSIRSNSPSEQSLYHLAIAKNALPKDFTIVDFNNLIRIN